MEDLNLASRSMERSAKKEMKLKRCDTTTTTLPKARDIGRIEVTGFEPGLAYGEDVESSLTRLFGSCGKITDVYVDDRIGMGFVYFLGEGAVDKALQLNGTNMGLWKISVEPYPFKDKPVEVSVEGYSRKLLDDEIKTAMTALFSSCGEIYQVRIIEKYIAGYRSGEKFAAVSIKGIEAAEKALELNGSYIGTKKVRVALLSKPPRYTEHRRVLSGRPTPPHMYQPKPKTKKPKLSKR